MNRLKRINAGKTITSKGARRLFALILHSIEEIKYYEKNDTG